MTQKQQNLQSNTAFKNRKIIWTSQNTIFSKDGEVAGIVACQTSVFPGSNS